MSGQPKKNTHSIINNHRLFLGVLKLLQLQNLRTQQKTLSFCVVNGVGEVFFFHHCKLSAVKWSKWNFLKGSIFHCGLLQHLYSCLALFEAVLDFRVYQHGCKYYHSVFLALSMFILISFHFIMKFFEL